MATVRSTGLLAGGLLALLAFAAGPLRADDATDEMLFKRYHQAIHTAALCEHEALEQKGVDDPNAAEAQEAQDRMGAVINDRLMGQISAGRRLALIEEAKAEVDRVIETEGCDSGSAQNWLAVFYAELEPALEP